MGALGGPVSAALSSDGVLMLGVYDFDFGAAVLETRVGDEVTRQRVAGGAGSDVGSHLALALDAAGVPTLAMYDRANGAVLVGRRPGDGWEVKTVDDGDGDDVGRGVALVVDGLGREHLAYRNESNRVLRLLSLATDGCRPAGMAEEDRAEEDLEAEEDWAPLELTASDMAAAGMPSGDFGEWPSLAIGGDHRLVFSFYDADRGNLVLGRCDGAQIQLGIIDGEDPETGDDLGDVGAWSSLAVDENGSVGVAYMDRSRGRLKYADSAKGEMVATVVDDGSGCGEFAPESGWVGQGASLVLFHDGSGGDSLPRIAYVDATREQVRLARRSAPGDWSCEVIAQREDAGGLPGGIGPGLDLVLSADDAATVAFGGWRLPAEGGLVFDLQVVSP